MLKLLRCISVDEMIYAILLSSVKTVLDGCSKCHCDFIDIVARFKWPRPLYRHYSQWDSCQV